MEAMLEKQKLWCKLKCKCFNFFDRRGQLLEGWLALAICWEVLNPVRFYGGKNWLPLSRFWATRVPFSEKVFGPGKQVFKLRPACLESWSFKMFLNMVIFKWNRLNVISDCLTLNNSAFWFARKSHVTFSPNQVTVKPVVSCTRAFFFRCAMIDPFGCPCSLWLAG